MPMPFLGFHICQFRKYKQRRREDDHCLTQGVNKSHQQPSIRYCVFVNLKMLHPPLTYAFKTQSTISNKDKQHNAATHS